MNIINDQYAIVTPIRCGTRWLWENLTQIYNLPKIPAVHTFDIELIKDHKVLFVSRNPYTKLRSVYRWLKVIKYIDTDFTWEDFVLSETFDKEKLTFEEQYGNKLDKIDKVVKLENINQAIQDILNVTLPPYDNRYFDNVADDGLTLEQAYQNTNILQKVNSRFEQDFIRFSYEKFNF